MRAFIATIALLTLTTSVFAETHLLNIRGYSIATSESANDLHQFSEFVFDKGYIVATGNGELSEKFPDAKRIDGGGKTVLPGLIDAHGHVAGLGSAIEGLDLTGTRSLDEALTLVKIYAERNRQNAWIQGRGWNQVLWARPEFPTKHDLDEIVGDRPVFLERVDGHAAWVNSAALNAAGLSKTIIDPPGGRILRDTQGDPTGVLVDAAQDIVEDVIPKPTEKDFEHAISQALQRLSSMGVTSVHDAGIAIDEVNVYRRMAKAGSMLVRVYAMLSGADENLAEFGPPLRDFGDGFLTIASVKLYADGALGSRGAALIEDYSDEANHRGLLFVDSNELTRHIQRINTRGFQANVHAIGDLANRVVLDAFEKVQNGKPSPLRNRIEHAQVLNLDDIERLRALGIVASMQATHATSDKNMAEDRVGAERIKGAYAWRRLLDADIVIAGGSDFPVEPANPMFGLHAAVTRRDRNDEPVGGWYSDQAMTRAEALRSFTSDAAYAAHQEAQIGKIAPGMRADFIVIDQDFFAIPASDIWKIKVEQTWVNGKQVFGTD